MGARAACGGGEAALALLRWQPTDGAGPQTVPAHRRSQPTDGRRHAPLTPGAAQLPAPGPDRFLAPVPDPETRPHAVPSLDAPVDAAPRGDRRRHRPGARVRTSVARPAHLWLRAATLAAAATLGALVGFGLSDGASLARLGVVTLRLRGLPEFVSPDRGATAAALLGGVHVALVSGAWGAAAAALGGWLRARGAPRRVHGAAFVGLGVLLALVDGVLPAPLRLAAGALGATERVLVALLVAAAAWGASRLSDPPP